MSHLLKNRNDERFEEKQDNMKNNLAKCCYI